MNADDRFDLMALTADYAMAGARFYRIRARLAFYRGKLADRLCGWRGHRWVAEFDVDDGDPESGPGRVYRYDRCRVCGTYAEEDAR